MNKIKPNEPLENLTEDFLSLQNKSKQITSFIDSYYSEFKFDVKNNYIKHNDTIIPKIENSMLVLYGDWGSGKTSVMKDVQTRLKNNAYKTVFFNAWEYEKDGNLALSLFDTVLFQLVNEIEVDKKLIKWIRDFFRKIRLKSLTLGGSYKDVKGSMKFDFLDSESSFYLELESFKKEFQIFESEILKTSLGEEDPSAKLIVFIDDLDRCEPENVLFLLSSIKLFFTYTKRTLYFSGIDKKAVQQSVKIRYNDVVKSEEYLEKIFDISFSMPREIKIKNILNYYFEDDEWFKKNNDDDKENKEIKLITDFFKAIKFTNARHLKKLLNKYRILKYTKNRNLYGHELIPDLDNIINVIFTLYFMVLYDYFPKDFNSLENHEERNRNLKDSMEFKNTYKIDITPIYSTIYSSLTSTKAIREATNKIFLEFPPFINLLFIFGEIKTQKITINIHDEFNGNEIINFYKSQNRSILNKFALFLYSITRDNGYRNLTINSRVMNSNPKGYIKYNIDNTILKNYLDKNKQSYTLASLFRMAKTIL